MITDLVEIRLLGEKKRPENERFRRYMKQDDHSDRILRRIAERIEELIDCTECGNCCKVATAKVAERDADRLARYLRISQACFLAEYAIGGREEGTILRRTEAGGVFLDGTTCTLYDARPETCRRFPHVCAAPVPSRAGCGNLRTAPVTARLSTTHSKRSSRNWVFGGNQPAKLSLHRRVDQGAWLAPGGFA